ncbi:MAG: hypothetical protein LH632_05090 [Rhodoferax sp.]|nr:hypothetical protein [Rhodoferax sp.]
MRSSFDLAVLKKLAGKYIWWKTPDDAVAKPQRVIAQVMNIGDCCDVQELAVLFGDDVLRRVLEHAEPGYFNARSWACWHYLLQLAVVNQVPPLPVRRFA